jgi:starch synthase (maltosyl-transferring)
VSHESIDFFRPNFWVNTPDILTEYLQFGGRPAFKIRAIVAATSCSLWGMYSGFELFEAVARPGAEENIDSEKYEYKSRDWALAEKSGNSLAPLVAKLNAIRDQHPALQQQRNLHLHWSDDSAIIAYSKHLDGAFTASGRPNTIITVVNLDPHSVRETMVHLDLPALGLETGATFSVRDLITGARFEWGEHNFVRLDAFTEPAHILEVEH